jgi:hypothetical protein
MLVVSFLHHLSVAHLLEQQKVNPMLSIAKRLVVRAAQHMASGITTAKGLEVGHWNIE